MTKPISESTDQQINQSINQPNKSISKTNTENSTQK